VAPAEYHGDLMKILDRHQSTGRYRIIGPVTCISVQADTKELI
jgi:hypothetical protein